MGYRAIILTGTSGAGKSTLSKLLRDYGHSFEQVKAVTTRAHRPDDEPDSYDYLSQDQFELVRASLIISAEYRGMHYGITRDHLADLECRGKTPVLVITPRSLAEFLDREQEGGRQFMSVFIDAPNDILDSRLNSRGNPERQAEIDRQRMNDRSYCDRCQHVLQNIKLDESLSQLLLWWDGRTTV